MNVRKWAPEGKMCNSRLVITLVLCGILLGPGIAAAATEPFPTAAGSGFFTYDGSSLTLDAGTVMTQIIYSVTEFAFMPAQDQAVGSSLAMTGVAQVGNTLDFSDGTITLKVGAETILSADIIDVALSLTGPDTGVINPTPLMINLENVVVAQPTGPTSRFVTDWQTASGGSGLGGIGLTFTNTNPAGTFQDALNNNTATADGNVLFTIQTALPEPGTTLLILVGGGWVLRRRR